MVDQYDRLFSVLAEVTSDGNAVHCIEDLDIYNSPRDILGFWITRCGFRTFSSTGLRLPCQCNLRFRIPIFVGIPNSLSLFIDSKAQDSGFTKPKFPGFQVSLPRVTQSLGILGPGNAYKNICKSLTHPKVVMLTKAHQIPSQVP